MKILNDFIEQIELGEIQTHENMVVFPLFHSQETEIEYITLSEALEDKIITIKEIDEEGSVPELRVINSGDMPVFMLDGEELVGAKQNRVLNTSILLKEKSETVIPVSCTEAGRWSFKGENFDDSGVVMAANIRRAKNYSVSESLMSENTFRSNQGMVWAEIEEMASRADVHSATKAMHDIFEKRKRDIDGYVKAFGPVPNQKGLMVMINGSVMGFDIISLESAYEKLHQKLIKSYAVEAWLEKKDKRKSSKKGDTEKNLENKVKKFLSKINGVTWKRFKSVGYGWDFRHKSDDKVGSALVHDDEIIHMAFFNVYGVDKGENIADLRIRRSFRM